MKIVRVGLAGITACAMAGGLTAVAAAAPTTVTDPVGTVSCSIADIALDGPDPVEVIAQCSWIKTGAAPANASFIWKLNTASPDGTQGPFIVDSAPFGLPAAGTTTSTSTFTGEGSGAKQSTLTFEGTMDSYVSTAVTTHTFVGGSFTVTRSRSAISGLKVKMDRRFALPTRVSARVMAKNSKGASVPIDGSVVAEVREPGSRIWKALPAGSLDDAGHFEAAYPEFVRGSQLRVTVVECGWCTDVAVSRRIS